MLRKIVDQVPPDILQADLEMFRQKALELGATDAKIISNDEVIIDERVRAKCMNPKCPNYGTNAHCPPHVPDLETVRKTINKYRYGLLVITKYPSEEFNGKFSDSPATKDRFASQKLISKLEDLAFNSGYYLAMGFADGPCKSRYCPDQECSVLKGQGCRMGLKARYSMESWGMDVYLMSARAGWEIYPVGVNTSTEDVPFRVAVGLVMIY